MPPVRRERNRNDSELYPHPGVAAERRARLRNLAARRARRTGRQLERSRQEGLAADDEQQREVTHKHLIHRMQHGTEAIINETRRMRDASRVPTIDFAEEDMFGDPEVTESETEGGRIKRGKGWEEELAKAIARDKEREADKEVANRIRADSAADAKRRGGRVIPSSISRKLH